MSAKQTSLIAASAFAALTATPAYSESREFDLKSFDKIEASSGIAVHVSVGERQNVRVEARGNSDFKHLKISVENGTLRVGTDYNFLDFIIDGGLVGSAFRNGHGLDVHVTIPELAAISASSGAAANVRTFSGPSLAAKASSGASLSLMDVAFEDMQLRASSGGDIAADGTCVFVQTEVSSGADINATKLECKSADISASSGGDAGLFASDSVIAKASSGGSISVRGNPKHRDVRSSSGGGIDIAS